MARRRNVRSGVRPIYTFLLSWLFLSAFMPMFLPATFLVSLGLGGVLTYFLVFRWEIAMIPYFFIMAAVLLACDVAMHIYLMKTAEKYYCQG